MKPCVWWTDARPCSRSWGICNIAESLSNFIMRMSSVVRLLDCHQKCHYQQRQLDLQQSWTAASVLLCQRSRDFVRRRMSQGVTGVALHNRCLFTARDHVSGDQVGQLTRTDRVMHAVGLFLDGRSKINFVPDSLFSEHLIFLNEKFNHVGNEIYKKLLSHNQNDVDVHQSCTVASIDVSTSQLRFSSGVTSGFWHQ